VEHVPIVIPPNEHNEAYLKTKEAKMGHWLDPDRPRAKPSTKASS
jgi:hypothetical protein